MKDTKNTEIKKLLDSLEVVKYSIKYHAGTNGKFSCIITIKGFTSINK